MMEELDNIVAIKNQGFANAIDSLFPEEGMTRTVRGGLGSKVVRQSKKENGVYFKRDNETEDWKVFDPHEYMSAFIDDVIRSC